MLKKFPSHIQSRTRGGRLCSGEQSHSWMRRFVMSRLHPCLTFLVSRAATRRTASEMWKQTHTHKKTQRFKSASLAGEPNHPSESRLHSTLIEKLNRKKNRNLAWIQAKIKIKIIHKAVWGVFFLSFSCRALTVLLFSPKQRSPAAEMCPARRRNQCQISV